MKPENNSGAFIPHIILMSKQFLITNLFIKRRPDKLSGLQYIHLNAIA
jgi:hypothetical protein